MTRSTMAEHTPGPWRRERQMMMVVSDRANICHMLDGGTLAGEAEANADLIAAARRTCWRRFAGRTRRSTWPSASHGTTTNPLTITSRITTTSSACKQKSPLPSLRPPEDGNDGE